MTEQPAAARRALVLGGSALVATWLAALAGLSATVGLPRAERTAVSGSGLPGFVDTPRAVQAYRAALALPALIVVLPCYCGCVGLTPAHRSLYDCFVRPDGAYEPHAAGCMTCQDEALDAQRWTREGLAAAEVRRRVDAAYRDSGPPTHTPPVA